MGFDRGHTICLLLCTVLCVPMCGPRVGIKICMSTGIGWAGGANELDMRSWMAPELLGWILDGWMEKMEPGKYLGQGTVFILAITGAPM